MWVLQICHCYYPPFLDCARQYNILFKDSAYKVLTVYLTGDADEQVAKETAADEVIFLGYKSKQVSGLKLGAIVKIRDIVQQREFVFCIAHRAKPTYVALLSNKLPVISVHHNYGDFGRFSRRLIVNLFRNRLLLLGVSNSVRDEMRLSLPKWPQEKIQTLYNHIDIKKVQSALVSKSEARIVLKLPQDAWVIGNVGRLHHDKDQATLIKGFAKALPQLPKDSLLVIIGSGPLESSLKQLALELQVTEHVVFTGQVQNARHYFKAFDVFALTSDCEPFGMVLLEAMAAGVTVICSDCGGGVEVIRGVGELFEFGNVAALSGCIVKMAYKKGKIDEFSMSQKLKDNFSDEAGKKNFWSLPQFDSNNRLTLKNF